MLQRTHTLRAQARHDASALSPARRWAEPAAGSTASAGGGHDLARISVSAPAASAPIQRVRWRWDASSAQWDAVGASSSSSVAPTHAGSTHGEEYDDEYSQATDPTATPYHKSGRQYFGEAGADLQSRGITPRPEQIREEAVGGFGRTGGAGLHEVLPTNLLGDVARWGNPALIGAQSGLRTATDYQLFSPAATNRGEVGGHTGFFRRPGSSSSTHTGGQSTAHDTLRAAARSVKNEGDPDVVVNTLTLAHITSTPTGQDVLQSGYITSGRPNRSRFGAVGPVAAPGAPPDAGRLALAQDVHARRELVKARERGRARERDPGRQRLPSPSPERRPIDASGGGGDYVPGDRTTWATAPVPRFPGVRWRQVANETAWLTQPQRHPFDVSTAPLIRPAPSSGGASSSVPVAVSTPAIAPPLAAPPPGIPSSLLGTASTTAPLPSPASSSTVATPPVQLPAPATIRGGRRRGKKRRTPLQPVPGTTAAAAATRRNPPRAAKKPRTH